MRLKHGSVLAALAVILVVGFIEGWGMLGWNPTLWDLMRFLNELTAAISEG